MAKLFGKGAFTRLRSFEICDYGYDSDPLDEETLLYQRRAQHLAFVAGLHQMSPSLVSVVLPNVSVSYPSTQGGTSAQVGTFL